VRNFLAADSEAAQMMNCGRNHPDARAIMLYMKEVTRKRLEPIAGFNRWFRMPKTLFWVVVDEDDAGAASPVLVAFGVDGW